MIVSVSFKLPKDFYFVVLNSVLGFYLEALMVPSEGQTIEYLVLPDHFSPKIVRIMGGESSKKYHI